MKGSDLRRVLSRLSLKWLAGVTWTSLALAVFVQLSSAAAIASGKGMEKGADVSRWPANQAAPRLEATDLDGKLWRIQELRGRAVLLYFGDNACKPCRVDIQGLHKLAEIHDSQKLVILVINVGESSATTAQYAREAALTLPVLPDASGAIAKTWGVTALPATVLVAADGKPRQRIRGKVDWSSPQVAKLIESLFRREKRLTRPPSNSPSKP